RLRAMDSQWLLATLDGNRLTKNALKLALCRAFDAAGVQFKGIHAFRRASGIEYLRQGGQAEDLRVLMGWRSPGCGRRDLHIVRDRSAQSVSVQVNRANPAMEPAAPASSPQFQPLRMRYSYSPASAHISAGRFALRL
ncbi:MAG: hypothetical protein Q8P22_13720, partial [Chloroflexota bacterium]|nr:hypothetical protein [Chloroflexota bacterium]